MDDIVITEKGMTGKMFEMDIVYNEAIFFPTMMLILEPIQLEDSIIYLN